MCKHVWTKLDTMTFSGKMPDFITFSLCGRSSLCLDRGSRHSLRDYPFITFARRGGGGDRSSQKKLRTKVLIGCVKMQIGGGPKSRKFCLRNKWMPPNLKTKYASIISFSCQITQGITYDILSLYRYRMLWHIGYILWLYLGPTRW